MRARSEHWTRGFREKWNLLELEYASVVDTGSSLPDASVRDIRNSIEEILAMVDDRIAALY
jgi:hypothetical protein